jgi:hypothetical protein
MANPHDIIDQLSGEELDLLNSDPQLLADFKAKHVDNSGFQLLSQDGGINNPGKANDEMANYWKAKGDNPEAGAEKPVEQRLAENTVAAGSGAMLPEGLMGLGKAAMNIGKSITAPAGEIADTAAKYAGRFGENQAIKSLGARMGQIGDLGIPESRATGRAMVERGIINPLQGPIGLEAKVKGLSNAAGENIGNARSMADERAFAAGESAPGIEDLTNLAKKKLGPSYESGHLSGRSGTYNKALESLANPVIKDTGEMTGPSVGTFEGNAAKATELNAAGTPDKALSQAENSPYSDIANMVSKENNAGIQSTMSPEEWAQHQKDLGDYSLFQPVKKFMEAGEKREMGGRGGASLTKTIYDKTMDSFGNRTSAVAGLSAEKGLNAVAQTLKSFGSPTEGLVDIVKNSPQMLGKFAVPLSQAFKDGGNQGIAAMHYVLSTTNPEYNQLTQEGNH